jgi:hypothetical protein
MRGTDVQQGGLVTYVSLEDRIPADHLLRGVRVLLNEALESMRWDFDRSIRRTAERRSRSSGWCGR